MTDVFKALFYSKSTTPTAAVGSLRRRVAGMVRAVCHPPACAAQPAPFRFALVMVQTLGVGGSDE